MARDSAQRRPARCLLRIRRPRWAMPFQRRRHRRAERRCPDRHWPGGDSGHPRRSMFLRRKSRPLRIVSGVSALLTGTIGAKLLHEFTDSPSAFNTAAASGSTSESSGTPVDAEGKEPVSVSVAGCDGPPDTGVNCSSVPSRSIKSSPTPPSTSRAAAAAVTNVGDQRFADVCRRALVAAGCSSPSLPIDLSRLLSLLTRASASAGRSTQPVLDALHDSSFRNMARARRRSDLTVDGRISIVRAIRGLTDPRNSAAP